MGSRSRYRSEQVRVGSLGKDRPDHNGNYIDHVRRLVSYVHRHQAQRPEGDVEDSNWRYSLLNWGHDPLK